MNKKNKNCSLVEALDYKNEDVIFRFTKIFNVTEEEALHIFEQTKKWLWLCSKSVTKEIDIFLFIDDSLLIIDEMWHNFMLFSKDYNSYCFDKFGFFIHHQPTTKRESEKWELNKKANMKNYFENLKKQYNIIYDFLGRETLVIWYNDLANEYTKEKIKLIYK